jgi:signal transduction histidine kinase
MLFGAYPWQDGDTIHGAVLLFSPQEAVASIVSDIRRALWLTAAAFVLIGGVVIYLFTRRIVRPIRAIEGASAQMANGVPVEDISIKSQDELGSLARSFNSMKNKLAQNEAMRQELIANVSHDLRTPLTSINGFVSGMADGVIRPEDYPRYIGIIRQQTQKLISLTDGILDTAKLRSGRIELTISDFPLSEAVAGAMSLNAAFAASRNVRIHADVAPGLSIQADRNKLEQAIYNLLANAVKFSPVGGEVSVTAEKAEGGLSVTVADNGPGIPAEELPLIFDRYYSVGSSAGAGVGLGIVKSYAQAHGGHVDVTSESGQGSRFRLFIPRN